MTDMSLRPSDNNPGRTYKWYGDAVYPFGYGLHYTTFEYVWISSTTRTIDLSTVTNQLKNTSTMDRDRLELMSYAVNITNTGFIVSDTVVLLFTNTSSISLLTPRSELIGYQRVHRILPGQCRTVYFTITVRSLSQVDEHGHRWLRSGEYRIFIGHDAIIEDHLILTGQQSLLIQQFPSPLMAQAK